MRADASKGVIITLVVVVSLAGHRPAGADAEQDTQLCQDATLAAENRIEACLRLAAAGEPAAVSALARDLFERGTAQYGGGNPEAAFADLDAAIALNPNDAEYFSTRGIYYWREERLELARQDLERAIEVGPVGAWEHERLGIVYEDLDLFDLALEQYSIAIEESRNPAYSYYLRGSLYSSPFFSEPNRNELAILDFDEVIARVPSAGAFHHRGWAYRSLGEQDNRWRDTLVSYLLDPNWLYVDWAMDEVSLSREFVFGRSLEETRPTPALPEQDVFHWSPPLEGLHLAYVRVDNEEQPVDPMMAAINDLIDWFVRQDRPLPIESTIFDYYVGRSEGIGTEVRIMDRYTESFVTDEANVALALSMIPTAQAYGAGPSLQRSYGGDLEKIDGMELGEVHAGEGILFVDCPEQPGPITIIAGCAPGMDHADVGQFHWSLTFEGWEDTLVPARRAATARVSYTETASITILGQTRVQELDTTWWIDPEIGWWLRRENIQRMDGAESGIIETMEAMEVTLPR